MAHSQNTIQKRKYKHLTPFERGKIAALHKEGHSNREIARRLGRVHSRLPMNSSAEQRHNSRPEESPTQPTFLKRDKAVYERNRKNCDAKSKLLEAAKFIHFTCEKIINHDWSPDAVVGFSSKHEDW